MLGILDPTISPETEDIVFVPRPAALGGLRIGLLENTRKNSEGLLRKITERFVGANGGELVYLLHKHQRAPLALDSIAEIKGKIDFAICGIGDCGACSSGSVLDAIMLEKHGIPAISIVTTAFEETAKEMAQLWGVPEFRFLQMPHPLGSLTDHELELRADELVGQVATLLTEGQEQNSRPLQAAE